MRNNIRILLNLLLFAAVLVLLCGTNAMTQSSGGQFKIEKSAISSGGETNLSGGGFTLAATIGQNIAGQQITASPFSIYAGFWSSTPLAPTAAFVIVGGRVATADGRGIRNVRVTMTEASGETKTAISGAFGYFRFENVPAGGTYIFTAFAKNYQFGETAQVKTILEDTGDVNFIAITTPPSKSPGGMRSPFAPND